MDTSRSALMTLLELQKVDTAIDRYTARCANLPEQAALDALEAKLVDLEGQIVGRQAALEDATTRQKRLEVEVDSVAKKIAIESNRLYSGMVGNAKELSDLSREVEALGRRKGVLEDHELEVMEEREGIEGELASLTQERTTLVEQTQVAREARDVTAGEVGRQLSAAQAERERWAPKVDADLLKLYGTIRTAKGGVGVAGLIDDVCQGCHLRLPAQEAQRVRTSAGLVRCDDCRRILVPL